MAQGWQTCDLAGKNVRPFANGLADYGFPSPGPDGKRILWMHFIPAPPLYQPSFHSERTAENRSSQRQDFGAFPCCAELQGRRVRGTRKWTLSPNLRAHRDRPLRDRGIVECGKMCLRKKTGLAGNPSGVDRAARLREIPPSNRTARILAVAPSRRRDVQENHAACRGTHCFGRTAVGLD